MEETDKSYMLEQAMGSVYAFKKASDLTKKAIEKGFSYEEVQKGLIEFIDSEFDRVSNLYNKIERNEHSTTKE